MLAVAVAVGVTVNGPRVTSKSLGSVSQPAALPALPGSAYIGTDHLLDNAYDHGWLDNLSNLVCSKSLHLLG